MHDASLVSGIEGIGNLPRNVERLVHRQRTVAEQPIGERATFDELEHERANAVAFLDAVDRGNARMVERGEYLRFPIESCQPFGVARERLRQHFECDVTIEPQIAGPIDFSHAAGPHGLNDFVGTETRTGSEGH